MVAELRPEIPLPSTTRGRGCSDMCMTAVALVPGVFGRREVLLHDPETHEAYGQRTANPRLLKTGALVVDRDNERVYVNGQEVALSSQEWSILAQLATCAGSLRPHDAILTDVWGPDYLGEWHLLRVAVSRLRTRLKTAGGLIRTNMGRGYSLEIVAPIEARLAPLPLKPAAPWSRGWDACRECGTNDRPHYARGLCATCGHRASRQAKRAASGAAS